MSLKLSVAVCISKFPGGHILPSILCLIVLVARVDFGLCTPGVLGLIIRRKICPPPNWYHLHMPSGI